MCVAEPGHRRRGTCTPPQARRLVEDAVATRLERAPRMIGCCCKHASTQLPSRTHSASHAFRQNVEPAAARLRGARGEPPPCQARLSSSVLCAPQPKRSEWSFKPGRATERPAAQQAQQALAAPLRTLSSQLLHVQAPASGMGVSGGLGRRTGSAWCSPGAACLGSCPS